MADAGRGESSEAIDRASRLLASAWGCGSAWGAIECPVDKARRFLRNGNESNPAATPGLTMCRQSETLERVNQFAHRGWLERQPEIVRKEVLAWERANAHRGAKRFNVTEHEHWQRTPKTAAYPLVRPSRTTRLALASKSLKGPLADLLLLFALEDWSRWPNVRRYAVACIPAADWDRAIDDVMHSIPQTRSGWLLWRWLDRAAFEFLKARQEASETLAILESMQPSGEFASGSQGHGHRAETWWHPEREKTKPLLKMAA